MQLGGVELGNPKYINAAVPSTSAAGDIDVYTVPSGRRCLIHELGAFNQLNFSTTVYAEAKIGGVYYQLSLPFQVNPGQAIQKIVPIVLEAGDTFAINVNGGGSQNLWASGVEYDAGARLYSPRLVSFSAGDNTIYTVPNCHSAGFGVITLMNTASMTGLIGQYSNNSGSARTVKWNAVPSGGSVGVGNQVSNTALVTSAFPQNPPVLLPTMGPGGFININVDAATATQFAWLVVAEIPLP